MDLRKKKNKDLFFTYAFSGGSPPLRKCVREKQSYLFFFRRNSLFWSPVMTHESWASTFSTRGHRLKVLRNSLSVNASHTLFRAPIMGYESIPPKVILAHPVLVLIYELSPPLTWLQRASCPCRALLSSSPGLASCDSALHSLVHLMRVLHAESQAGGNWQPQSSGQPPWWWQHSLSSLPPCSSPG